MDPFICMACGTQYTPSSVAPRQCAICEEERQYVPPRGQTWTTLGALAAGHFNSYRQYEPGVIGIGTQPSFAIGQRALLVCTPSGNALWDCIAMLDPATITLINGLGGLKAIGISHHGIDATDNFSRAAAYADRILNGEKPADLPVQAPTKYELVINLKTAKSLGIEVPPSLLARADEVIE